MGEQVRIQLSTGLRLASAWPGEIHHFESLGSTNAWMKDAARRGLPEWSVVLADRQLAGRGRHGRGWASPPGNLYLSLLWRPRLAASQMGLLPLLAGVAVAEAAAGWGVRAQLKWPNDILAGGRKLGGILVEGLSAGSGIEALIVGVGLNLLRDPGGLAPEVLRSATSVEAEADRVLQPVAAAVDVLRRLRAWYDVPDLDPATVLDAWRGLSVPWWGRLLEVRSGAEVVRGVAEGIEERGGLVLRREDGSRLVLFAGEARELRPAEGAV